MHGGGVTFGGGPSGPAGADGNTVLYGTGAPSAGVGVNGNFYIDTTAHAIYGPKAGGSWGASTSLVGPSGSGGSAGADGKTVIYGSGVPASGTGNNGDTFIDSTGHVLYGPKAAGAWPAGVSLVGPQGDNIVGPLVVFGGGSDGDLTMASGSVTLAKDMYYRNVTLSGTASIDCNGFKIFISGTLDISNAPTNAIKASATDASQTIAGRSDSAFPGGVLSAPGQIGSIQGGGVSGNVALGSTGVGTGALAPSANSINNGGSGGAGGASGISGTGNAGAASRAGNSVGTTARFARRVDFSFLNNTAGCNGGIGGSCGGSGGGDGTNSSNSSPPSGAGAGTLSLAARTITRGASTAMGAISAKGGNAGKYTTPLSTGNIGGYGGSGGGGGGYIFLVYQTLTGAQATACLRVDGGDGSQGGDGKGSGVGGQGGAGGGCGRVVVCDLTAGTITEAVSPSATGSLGTVPAGAASVGSAGSAGVQGRSNL